jgi:hypothetical protein
MTQAPERASIDDSCTRTLIDELADKGQRLSVCLDGVELQNVVEYDTVAGYAIAHRMIGDKAVMAADGRSIARSVVVGNISASIVRR